jgi:hypothetical protein
VDLVHTCGGEVELRSLSWRESCDEESLTHGALAWRGTTWEVEYNHLATCVHLGEVCPHVDLL